MRLTITAVIPAMLMLCGSLFAHAASIGFPKTLEYKGGPVLSGEVNGRWTGALDLDISAWLRY